MGLMGTHADCYGLTDPGKVHLINEDQFLIAELQKSMLLHQTSLPNEDHAHIFGSSQGQLLLVADGKGGAGFGDKASRIVLQAIARYVLNTLRWFFQLNENEDEDLADQLAEALARCRVQIQEAVNRQEEKHGMATTLTAAYILWPRLYVIQAGNSRSYLYRNSDLRQLTGEGSGAEPLKGAAPSSSGAALPAPEPPIADSGTDGAAEPHPEIHRATLEAGDTLLLCTDGLTSMLSGDAIQDVLRMQYSAERTCRKLIEDANAAGGKDNVTAVVARFAGREGAVDPFAKQAEARPPVLQQGA